MDKWTKVFVNLQKIFKTKVLFVDGKLVFAESFVCVWALIANAN